MQEKSLVGKLLKGLVVMSVHVVFGRKQNFSLHLDRVDADDDTVCEFTDS